MIRIEFWSLALALALLVTNTLSFNGALALVISEQLALAFLVFWKSRSLNAPCRRLGMQWFVVSFASLVVGFFVAAQLRAIVKLGFASDMTGFQEKAFQFITLIVVVYTLQMLALLAWGHFAARMKVEELPEAKYFSSQWIKQELLAPGIQAWAKEKVQKRLSEIRYHMAGLGSLKEGQVPEVLQARLKSEERQLTEVLSTLA